MRVATRTALRAVAETLTSLPYEAWRFGDSVAFDGLVEASAALGTDEYLAFARGFARGWFATTVNFKPLDCTAPGAALCAVAHASADALLAAGLVDLATYLVARRKVQGIYETWARSPLREPYGKEELNAEEQDLLSNPGPGVFLDCLHFDPPFFARLSRLTGDDRWAAEAIDQALRYVDVLQDKETGLFHHFFLERSGRTYIPGWGRGQGWALLGLLDVFESLPDTPDALADAVRALIHAMLLTQREDGHWDAVVGNAASSMESSTAAFMAFGFRRALRAGLVSYNGIAAAADRADTAVRNSLGADGRLADVSVAVWASTRPSHYAAVPRGVSVPWGQGPAALMLADDLRHESSDR